VRMSKLFFKSKAKVPMCWRQDVVEGFIYLVVLFIVIEKKSV